MHSDTSLLERFRASLVVQMLRNPPVMQETRVLSLGLEDTLVQEIATHFGTLAWGIPETEERAGLQPVESQESDRTEQLTPRAVPGPVMSASAGILLGNVKS